MKYLFGILFVLFLVCGMSEAQVQPLSVPTVTTLPTGCNTYTSQGGSDFIGFYNPSSGGTSLAGCVGLNAWGINTFNLNATIVVEGNYYPFTNTGLQTAINNCASIANCTEVFVVGGVTIPITTCLSGFKNLMFVHSASFASATLRLDADIDGFCPASLTQNLRIEDFQIVTNTGVTLTSNHAAIHLLNMPRPVVKNMLISTEATAGGCLLLENTGPAGNVAFGMWDGVFENITCQRTSPNQGTPDTNLGHFGVYCKGISSGTNPDCSMHLFNRVWVENHGVGMQFDFANSNTVTREHLLFNSINFKCVSCKDNTIIARLNQFRNSGAPVSGTNEHYNLDSGSSDNNLFFKLESPTTKGTDSGTRNNLLLGATDAWNFSAIKVTSGTASSPTLSSQAFPTYGNYMDTSNGWATSHGGVEALTTCTPGLCIPASSQWTWNSGAFSGGATPDTGLKRNAAGHVAPTNGSTGSGIIDLLGSTSGTYSLQAPAVAGTQTIIPIGAECSTSQKSETAADTNVLTCAIPSVAGTYRVQFSADVSAASSATLGWTATWTDSNASARTPTNLPVCISSAGTCAATSGALSAANNLSGNFIVNVNNAGTSIVVKLTFSGTSFAAKVTATVERVI